ncbi:shikimate dehydrogenase [Allorhodopirellula heiligendammensis]|uniref:Shikimate 5-dehydrogenase n=1 Tax=Allorhodopirellula heiligendammensis TaxID=2714739 RepID=A0A5C6BFD0_9BACT|nr:shikimate dehydrogenase [Allorhodopirellula heiligendammensis]TWU10006.1 hypothetical protein Poly21_53390 [Allorhodopirellula heiligendammensis]|tara:strand:+ start:107 stop:928 length:822 start_codon:yes stop_codon:yes gene_type:complete
MDGTTEPIIAIIGHPIAGNPTQFALETGFAAAQIDCRVLSVDLPPDRVSAAIAGMDAMNFRGIWITPSCRAASSLVAPQASLPLLDFLQHRRDAASAPPWTTLSLKQRVWPGLAGDLLDRRSCHCRKLWWIDDRAGLSADDLHAQRTKLVEQIHAANCDSFSAFEVDQIEIVNTPTGIEVDDDLDNADVIIWARSKNVPTQWEPSCRSIIIDLNENWDPEHLVFWDGIKAVAGDCLRGADVHAACLSLLTKLLFDRHVDPEVFQDAVDEYLAV